MKHKEFIKSCGIILTALFLAGCSKPEINAPSTNDLDLSPTTIVTQSITDENQLKDPAIIQEDSTSDAMIEDISSTRLAEDENALDLSGPITGIYQGQIDGHSIEILVDDQYIELNADDIGQYLDGLEKDDKVEFTASISASDQMMLESIKELK